MGFQFGLKHTKIVSYLTNPTAPAPPCTNQEIQEFLFPLASERPESRHYPMISSDQAWLHTMRNEARRVLNATRMVTPSTTNPVYHLESFRAVLSSFHQFVLITPDCNPHTRHLGERIAYAADHTLVMFPTLSGPIDQIERERQSTLAEFAVAAAVESKGPGMVIWNQIGTAAFIEEADIERRVDDIIAAIMSPDRGALDRLLDHIGLGETRRLLHLSDLHLGKPEAARNLPLLEAELHSAVKHADRVVITGDLFDTPDRMASDLFRGFRLSLERLSALPPVVVPGNHDQRISGILGQDFSKIAQIPHSPVLVDDDSKITFLCFNSAIAGKAARGRITSDQLTEIGAEFRNHLAVHPQKQTYLPVVLVHHHPISFETPKTAWYQRWAARLGVSDEPFMVMEDAAQFLDWCARWRTTTILHGHKHVPRYHSIAARPRDLAFEYITAIGCGTSLGIESAPMTYNMVYWDEPRRVWLAKYYESSNGGPFVPKALTPVMPVEQPRELSSG